MAMAANTFLKGNVYRVEGNPAFLPSEKRILKDAGFEQNSWDSFILKGHLVQIRKIEGVSEDTDQYRVTYKTLQNRVEERGFSLMGVYENLHKAILMAGRSLEFAALS